MTPTTAGPPRARSTIGRRPSTGSTAARSTPRSRSSIRSWLRSSPARSAPYVGLEAFREGQHEVFFGRSRLLADLIAQLSGSRLVAVLGSSGSGKSSVVLGGLLPALKSGALPGSAGWHYPPPLVPGSEPLRNLARAFLPAGAEADAWLAVQNDELARDPGQHLARLAAARGGGAPTVLVVDQFEEIFTLCEDNRVRQAFITGLLSLLRTAAPQHRVVLTMRSDYEAKVTLFPELQPAWETGKHPVPPLSAAELRDAIEKPAERVGLRFEEGVVPALLNDLLGEQAGLPLLQFTLLKLWERRDRNRVTWAAYRRLGGGRAALAKCAEELYENLKLTENQRTAKRILLRMVRPDAGLEFTSSRIRLASLDKIGEDPGRIARVLDSLVKAHLVRLTLGDEESDAQVEVAHEALVRNWPRLNDWLQELRVKEATRRRLEAWAADWVRLGRGRRGLLYGSQLAEAEAWLASPEAAELGHDGTITALVLASRRMRLLRKTLLWLLILSPVIAWGVFSWRLRADLAMARQEKAGIEGEMQRIGQEMQRIQEEKGKIEKEKEAAEKSLQQAMTDAEQTRIEAAAIKKEADMKSSQAAADIQSAQLFVAQANEKAQTASDAVLLAGNRVAKNKLEALNWQDRANQAEAREAQANKNAVVLEERAAALEKRTKDAEQRWRGLEREVVDGGDESKNPTIPTLLMRIQDNFRKRIELHQFRRRQRPVMAGASAGSYDEKSLTGTICCLVRDAQGEYLLSRASVFAGSSGTSVIQPSREDSPLDRSKNIVAKVVRAGANENRAAAIARLRDGIAIDPQIPRVGRIEGIADGLQPGMEVWLVGRGSGLQRGKILHIDADGTIVTNIQPSSGDTGGPLLTPGRRLIGMLWGWSVAGRESYVAPIRPILEELKVELVTAAH